MLGLMQHHPLLISSLLDHAEKAHHSAQIVSLMPGAPAHRCGYADIARRARQVAQALGALGIREGDRVGTMAWNGYRHLELFFGVSGMGAVLHTVNPRLFPEQIAYIVNHAENQVLFFRCLLRATGCRAGAPAQECAALCRHGRLRRHARAGDSESSVL